MLGRRARALWALLLLVTACSSGADPQDGADPPATRSEASAPSSSTTRAPTTTTTVALPPPSPVAWRACGGGFDCGTITAPIDYQDHARGTLELAVIRRPAGDPTRRIGSLLVNPGGPGASGVRRVRRGFTISREVAARFDIIGFDPRGIGGSTPVRCGSQLAAFRSSDLDPETPQKTAALAAAAATVANECVATEGERLAHLGTREVVHDVEVIRRAIGEPQVSFVGLSYGTLIGLLWAEAYPGSVRALVLDGVVDPASGGDATAQQQVTAIDEAMHTIDAACSATPSCALGDLGGVLAAYDELARRLDAGAVAGHGVGPTQLAYAAFSATYDADRWPLLWDALRRGLDGDLAGISTMAEWFTNLVAYPPFAIVTCLDSDHPTGFDAWQAAAARTAQSSPRFGRIAANELLPCAWWPAATYEPHRVQARGAPPILVIGSTGDVATPYPDAVRVAGDLATGVLLTVELDGHIALGDSSCADTAVTRYLVDLATPPPGSRC